MIQELSIKDYKAFENAHIPIKPLTIFLGANSVGKSSIIQLLLLLQQTSKEDYKSYKSALKLYGGYVNLGDSKNLFRKQDHTKDIEIGFKINDKSLKEFLKQELLKDYTETFSRIPKYLPIKAFLELRNKEIKNKSDFEDLIDAYIKIISKDGSVQDFIKEIRWFLSSNGNIKIDELKQENKSNLIKVYNA
ncbi:AAA family ATPase, partial [Empedobacter sp. UBA5039]